MTPEQLETLKAFAGPAHRVGKGAARMLFRREVDPLTGAVGRLILRDDVRSALEAQGIDADEYAARVLQETE